MIAIYVLPMRLESGRGQRRLRVVARFEHRILERFRRTLCSVKYAPTVEDPTKERVERFFEEGVFVCSSGAGRMSERRLIDAAGELGLSLCRDDAKKFATRPTTDLLWTISQPHPCWKLLERDVKAVLRAPDLATRDLRLIDRKTRDHEEGLQCMLAYCYRQRELLLSIHWPGYWSSPDPHQD